MIVYPQEFLSHFEHGLQAYKSMSWDGAIQEFKKALLLHEDEVSSMYIKRCRHFIKNPPDEKMWDGVFTLKTK